MINVPNDPIIDHPPVRATLEEAILSVNWNYDMSSIYYKKNPLPL